eukprot:COSAG02_NODE_27625_length_605_cov_3.318182_1_plen_61_part_10
MHCVVFLARAQGRRKGQAYDGDGASGATAGFRCVSDRFVASSTGQLSVIVDKLRNSSNLIP